MVRDYQSMQSLGLLWLVFDTGLSATPLMCYLGYLASHWSVPVCCAVKSKYTCPINPRGPEDWVGALYNVFHGKASKILVLQLVTYSFSLLYCCRRCHPELKDNRAIQLLGFPRFAGHILPLIACDHSFGLDCRL